MATFKPTLFAVTLAILVAVSSAAPNNQKPSSELGLKIPDECIGKGFCNIKPEGYDDMQDLVDSLLTPTFIANLGDRSGDRRAGLSPESDWDNCPTRTTVYDSPYTFSSNDSQPDYIIQHKLLRQSVLITNCALDKIDVTSSEQCFKGLGLTSAAFPKKTMCKTSSIMRSLFVLDYETKMIGTKSYPIDCCCHCMVENT